MNATFDQTLFSYKLFVHLVFPHTLTHEFFIRPSQPNFIFIPALRQPTLGPHHTRFCLMIPSRISRTYSSKLTHTSVQLGQTLISYNFIPLIHSSDSIHYFSSFSSKPYFHTSSPNHPEPTFVVFPSIIPFLFNDIIPHCTYSFTYTSIRLICLFFHYIFFIYS